MLESRKIVHVNEKSEEIVQQMYLKRLAWLFSQLDDNNDGVISANKICISTISEELLEIIKPVLFEMEEMKTELDFKDFKMAIQNLHQELNALERSILYNYRKKEPIHDVE